MSTPANSQKSTERVVLLLKPSEKQRLEKLAKTKSVSSAEILRRSLKAYEGKEDALEKEALAEMNRLLDGMVETLRTTRQHVQQTLARIDRQKRVEL